MKYTKLIAAVDAERAMRAIFGVPDLPRLEEDIFDVLEREAREASVAKHVADEYGTLEALEAAMDAEFAGQQGRTVEEMMVYLLACAASHDD